MAVLTDGEMTTENYLYCPGICANTGPGLIEKQWIMASKDMLAADETA